MNFQFLQMTLALMMALSSLVSCTGDLKEKIRKTKQNVSNISTITEKAREAKEDIENLKDAVPLTNEELKSWLPESVGSSERTGFKVGTAGYANVASIEGTYKKKAEAASDLTDRQKGEVIDKKLMLNIVDGAGPSGSMMIAGLGMTAKMDMELKDEYKHTQAVNKNGIRAQQTFHINRNETALQFVYNKRFGVFVNGINMDPDETWEMVEKLDFEELENLTK